MLFKEKLRVIRPDLGPRVGAFFTERTGGVSSGPWGGPDGIMGMNVGLRVGDNPGCVAANRRIVASMAGGEPAWLTQVHGTRVVDAESVLSTEPEADASVSVTPGVACAVQVADCLPVLVAEENGLGVAAIHAGWRSLAGGVVEEAVERLRRRLPRGSGSLRAWLGPRIGFDDFETGGEVCEAFLARYPGCGFCIREKDSGKFLLDLAGFARAALAGLGVGGVDDCGLSTAADSRRFYSYRREGARTGRHAAVVWIKAGEKQ